MHWNRSSSGSLRRVVRRGVLVLLPVLVTCYVLYFSVHLLVGFLRPYTVALSLLGVRDPQTIVVAEVVTVLAVVAVVPVVGAVASTDAGGRVVEAFDRAAKRVPGVSVVYETTQMVVHWLLDDQHEQFRSVKLVEFPRRDMYVIGFETAESPESVRDVTGCPTVTLFLPFAPNPVMGGVLAHVPEEQVHDVDMSIEAGVENVVTTGVAGGDVDQSGFVGTPTFDASSVDSDDGAPASSSSASSE
ncbi:MAG: DUF502 domain-containing protein [Haloplanus sp.]